MKRILLAGFAVAFAAAPVMAQNAQNSQSGRGTEQPNPAPSTTGADVMKPGASTHSNNSSAGLDESQARAKLEASGYSGITGLMVGPDGMWHGRAMRGSTPVTVGLDGQGNVIAR